MQKVYYYLVLIGIMCIVLVSCSRIGNQASFKTQQTRVITDSYGRTIKIPTTVKRIVPLGNAPRMLTYLGLADCVVGIPQCEHTDNPLMAYAYVNRELWKGLPNVGNDSLGAGEWYAEAIVSCMPDVVICTYSASIADEIQSQTGIPVITVHSPPLFSKEYLQSLRIIADVCGVQSRAEELAAYLDFCISDLRNRAEKAASISAVSPSVLAAGATFKGAHGIDGIYANYPVFEILKANDVANGITNKVGGFLVDREQILVWNPQIIFVDAGSIDIIRAEYAQNPAFFNQLQAIRNGNLYQWPNSTWHSSNVEIPLASAYEVGALLYPDMFADIDINDKISEIFDTFLSEPDFWSVLKNAGYDFKKITLEYQK